MIRAALGGLRRGRPTEFGARARRWGGRCGGRRPR